MNILVDIIMKTIIFLFMVLVLIIASPFILISMGWQVGKEIIQGKKPKMWGID